MHYRSSFISLILIQFFFLSITFASNCYSKGTLQELTYLDPPLNSLKPDAISDLCNSFYKKDLLKKINIIEPIVQWDDSAICSMWYLNIFHKDETLAKAFLKAKKNPEQTELLTGNPASYTKPKLRMSNIPTCANCHTYSTNGTIMAMDIDYKRDKGAFALANIHQDNSISDENIFSWNKIPVQSPAKYSMGLFSQLSPKGRYLAGTVNETSVFVMMDDLYFSQLFYPSTGQIAIFDQKLKKFSTLTGANNPKIVQTGQSWSPDGKTITFSATLTDLVLQPNSKLCLIPAEGGKFRELKSNMPIMNSWHSWSPNSKWMVFTCKATSPFTELYITHINEEGIASPAFKLFRLSHNNLAAMVPEFIPLSTKIPMIIDFNLPDLKAKHEMTKMEDKYILNNRSL